MTAPDPVVRPTRSAVAENDGISKIEPLHHGGQQTADQHHQRDRRVPSPVPAQQPSTRHE